MKINKLDEDWRDGKFDEGEFKAYSSRIIKDASRLSFSIEVMKREHPELDSQFKELFNTVKNIFDDGYSNESMDEAIGSNEDPAWLYDDTPEYRLDNDSEDWERVASKSVTDSDGFQTDYTMYKNSDGKYIFIFGDSDLYEADPDYADYEADNEEEAQEWFDDYRGPGEDIEDGTYPEIDQFAKNFGYAPNKAIDKEELTNSLQEEVIEMKFRKVKGEQTWIGENKKTFITYDPFFKQYCVNKKTFFAFAKTLEEAKYIANTDYRFR